MNPEEWSDLIFFPLLKKLSMVKLKTRLVQKGHNRLTAINVERGQEAVADLCGVSPGE